MQNKTTASPLNLTRVTVLLRNYKQLILTAACVCAFISWVGNLFEVPTYTSSSKLQMNVMNLNKLGDPRANVLSDLLDDTVRLNNMVLLFNSEVFFTSLAEELQNNQSKNDLILTWGTGRKLRLSYAFYRLGLSAVKFPKIDTASLSVKDLSILLAPMIKVFPNPSDMSIDLQVTALHPETAYLINKSVVNAFGNATGELNKREVGRTLEYFESQVQVAKAKLLDQEARLSAFLRKNPQSSSEVAINTSMNEYMGLQRKKAMLEKSIEANEQLYNFLKGKLNSASAQSGGIAESMEQLKTELVQLSYQRLKLKQQGYTTKDPGFAALDEKIKNLQKFINQENQDLANSEDGPLQSFDYQTKASERVMALYDKITQDRYELKSVEANIQEFQKEIDALPKNEMTATTLRREVMLSSEVYSDLVRKVELIKLRDVSERGGLRELGSPNIPRSPSNLPSSKRTFFAFFIGIALALSMILVKEAIATSVCGPEDLVNSWLQYAGLLKSTLGSQAEFYGSTKCLDSVGMRRPTPVMLCSSPSHYVDFKVFTQLNGYLVNQKRKPLMITFGKIQPPEGIEAADDLGYARIFRYPGNREDIVQVTDDTAFSSIKLLLRSLADSYDLIMIYVAGGAKNPVYYSAQAIANRLVIMGEIGVYTRAHYEELAEGFPFKDMCFVVLTPQTGRHKFSLVRFVKEMRKKTPTRNEIIELVHKTVEKTVDTINELKKAA